MYFDKNKVHTVLDADKIAIGSKCYFGNTLRKLRCDVNNDARVEVLEDVLDDDHAAIFCSNTGYKYSLAYLVASPGGTKYAPFQRMDEAISVLRLHGSLVKNALGSIWLITGYATKDGIDKPIHLASNAWISLDNLFRNYVFADDGTPCGVLC